MNSVSDRLSDCIELLKEQDKIQSFRQFALSIDYLPENLYQVLNERDDPGFDIINKACNMYGLDPNYILSGKGTKFTGDTIKSDFRILTIVTDVHNKERIVHVPVPAQAGYISELPDTVFYSELPTYSLPDFKYSQGTHRSFDVSGNSMVPVLEEGDKVVCSFLEPNQWLTGIKDDHVYVLITRTDVIVKRVKNLLKQDQCLLVISDNTRYRPYQLTSEDIREVWYVRTKITTFSHSIPHNPLEETVANLQDTIRGQQDMIQFLKHTIEKIEKI